MARRKLGKRVGQAVGTPNRYTSLHVGMTLLTA